MKVFDGGVDVGGDVMMEVGATTTIAPEVGSSGGGSWRWELLRLRRGERCSMEKKKRIKLLFHFLWRCKKKAWGVEIFFLIYEMKKVSSPMASS